jgi:hypothetical protein
MEEWKNGRLEDWKIGRLEDWKNGTPIPIAIGGIIGGNVEALAEIPLQRENDRKIDET